MFASGRVSMTPIVDRHGPPAPTRPSNTGVIVMLDHALLLMLVRMPLDFRLEHVPDKRVHAGRFQSETSSFSVQNGFESASVTALVLTAAATQAWIVVAQPRCERLSQKAPNLLQRFDLMHRHTHIAVLTGSLTPVHHAYDCF